MSYRSEIDEIAGFFRTVNNISWAYVSKYYGTISQNQYYLQFKKIREKAISDLFGERGIQAENDVFTLLGWKLLVYMKRSMSARSIGRSSVLYISPTIPRWEDIVNFAANYDILMQLLRPVDQEKAIRLKRILFGEDL